MESLSKVLQPYKDMVSTFASVITILQFFSGVFVCKDIYKKGDTKGIPSTPFIGGMVVGILTLKYGLLLEDAAMLIVNLVAIVLNFFYTVFYYYAHFENPDYIEFRYGMVLTILMLLLLGSPLLDVQTIIAKKDASSIQLPLTLAGTVVTLSWFLYGVILMNQFMIVQNLIGFILCVVQLVLLYLYPGRPTQMSKKKKQ